MPFSPMSMNPVFPQHPQQQQPKKALEVGKRPTEPEPKYAFPDVKTPDCRRRKVETEVSSTEAYLMFVNAEGKLIKTKLSTDVPDLTLGRHPDCKLQISRDEPSVSRFHASVKALPFTPANGGKSYCRFILRDMSSCGTGLNSSRLTHPVELEDGDRLFFGQAPFSVFFMRPKTCSKPSYEGELQMQGTSLGKRWSECYCCVARDVLLVFDKCNDSLPKTIIDLHGATTIPTRKPPNSFTVTVRGKSYNFAAETEQMMDEWMKVITVAAMNCRKNAMQGQVLMPAQPPRM